MIGRPGSTLLPSIQSCCSNQAGTTNANDGAEVADDPGLAQMLGQGPHRLHRGPAALLLGPSDALAAEQEGSEHDHEQNQLDQTGARVVPQQQLLDDTESGARGQRSWKAR